MRVKDIAEFAKNFSMLLYFRKIETLGEFRYDGN